MAEFNALRQSLDTAPAPEDEWEKRSTIDISFTPKFEYEFWVEFVSPVVRCILC